MNDTNPQIRTPPVPPEAQAPAVVHVSAEPSPPCKPRLRLWPGVVIIVLQWLLIEIPEVAFPGTMQQFLVLFWGPILCLTALVSWWLFASRLRWTDRWLGLLACAAGAALTWLFSHPTFGLFGMIIYALPVATTAWVVWLLITGSLSGPVRRVGLLVVFLLAWGYFTLVRFDGINGTMSATFHYRWTPTAEQRFLAESAAAKSNSLSTPSVSNAKPLSLEPGDWPGFRGPDRNGRLKGVRMSTDWKAHPPQQVWRHRIGPGWSSFAVVGTRLYTQEQRGEEEAVVCYDAGSGTEIWAHQDAARFTELVSGPGPRATPTFHEGRVYAQGAAGRLNCLDAASGRVLWSTDIVADSGAKVPIWGFAASPLISKGVVTVFAGGPEGKSVLGYNASSGDLLWSGGEDQYSYCSLQPARFGGVEQVVIAGNTGLTAFDPAHGDILWRHDWPLQQQMARVVQPTLLSDSDVLLGTGMVLGTRRVHVTHSGKDWSAEEVWTSLAIKPYYNDLVVQGDHLYGFDGHFFTCVALSDGKSKWRARGYGNGQVLLLADQDLLLILSEKGEVALVDATPDGHKERGRFQAIEGKTWNHPVVAHGKLFVRNGEEAACYQLEQ